MSLTIIVATRGRPDLLKQTCLSILDNMTRADTTLLVAADDDDSETLKDIAWLPGDKRVLLSVKPREDTRGPKTDRALTEAPADVYMPVSDYTPIRKLGFDQLIVDAANQFPDGIGCVCTPLINASFPGIQAPTARLCELMGYIYPPHFPFWFIDHWLDDIARMIGRYFTVDIQSDHFSLANERSTIGRRDVAFWATYFDALGLERQRQASRIIDVMDEPEWRREQLRSNFRLVEFRSMWVNDCVRSMAGELEKNAPPQTEGYLRARERAIVHFDELRKEWQC